MSLQNSVKDKSHCRLHKFETPALTVGTLDSLMSLSDDLIKLNTQVEVRTNSLTCAVYCLRCLQFVVFAHVWFV